MVRIKQIYQYPGPTPVLKLGLDSSGIISWSLSGGLCNELSSCSVCQCSVSPPHAVLGEFKYGNEKTEAGINLRDTVLTPLVIYFAVITTSLQLFS